MTKEEKATEVVNLIIEDIKDRNGLDCVWMDIDTETRQEIRSHWIKIITEII
jgi:hypothetical protein